MVSGVLRHIKSKHGTSKNGKDWTAYRIGVEMDNGELEWFGAGFNAPKVTEGTYVSFEAEDGRFGMDVKGNIKAKKAPPKKAASSLVADLRQDSIVRQNACGTASRIVSDMITHTIIKPPGKVNERYDWYLEMVEEVTDKLFVGNRNPKTLEDITAGEPDAEEVDPDDPFAGMDDDDDWE